MSLDSLQQNYADATAYVIDRTVSPPKVLGEAFLVSKSRAVTCASITFNYTEAPWALSLHFPHPDATLGIKTVNLHNDFDKVAARKWYLAQTGNPGDYLSASNDMASLSVDSLLQELQPEKVGELNRALAIPFSSDGVEASGQIAGPEFVSILQGILQAQRTGLLTLLDNRNIPIARLAVAPGQIQKVYYRGLLGELAFFELYYRKPAAGFMFQSNSSFNRGNVRDISAPADALIQEAERRIEETPGMLTYLGGGDARYQRRMETLNPSDVSENIQWLAERLWASLDGYTTLDKLSEKVGADTYTVVLAIRELVNRAAVSMINRSTPFHCNGQIGTPLISHTDFEINAWDPLQAFYLDPLSGCPTWLQGNFFGVANALQPKNMLHTIAFPVNVPGALILKDYKLIGLHSAPHVPRPGQPAPPVKLYQMMWMGALLDLSTKKARSVADDQSATGEQQGVMAGLRSKMDITDEAAAAAAEKLEKYVCPSCYSTNTKVGPCFNCGTMIEPPPPDPEADGLKKTALADQIKKLQAKYKLSNAQLVMIGAVVIGLPLCALVALTSNSGSAPPPPVVVDSGPTHKSSEKGMQTAVDMAGFKATAIPGYWYEDTSEQTKPAPSFALLSEQSNQKVEFIVFDDMSPVSNLSNFVGLPPFSDVFRADSLEKTKIDENFQVLGDGNLHWFVGHYQRPKDKDHPNDQVTEKLLVGAFPSPVKGKSILVEGRALTPGSEYDYKTTLWLCDQMAADYTARGNAARTGEDSKKLLVGTDTKTDTSDDAQKEKSLASDEDIDTYCKKLEEILQPKLKLPDDVQEALHKKKPVKINAGLKVGFSEDGKVTKLEITQQPSMGSAMDALTKDVNACAPYENVPHTKEGTLTLLVKLNDDKITVKHP